MLKRIFGGRKEQKSDFEIVSDDEDGGKESDDFINELKMGMTKLIAYAQSADLVLQREVAERLANEAVKSDRQQQIVECGGLQLLVPITQSNDPEVRRLAAHALANLSVNAENQILMAKQGAIEMLIPLLDTPHSMAQRQSAKALANLGVNADNKRHIVTAGAVEPLVRLMHCEDLSVGIEAVAAVANLAVNADNEADLVAGGALEPIVEGARIAVEGLYDPHSEESEADLEEMAAQCARALRNLSVNPNNRKTIIDMGGDGDLRRMLKFGNSRMASHAKRALKNITGGTSRSQKSSRK